MSDSKVPEGFKPNPPELDGVADLSALLFLEMPNVVHNLKCRYDKDQIYTGISSILIAMNPYKNLPCYGQTVMEKYSSKAKHQKSSPHVYNVAEDAYRALVKSRSNQSMVVCGESGAGKSESAKHLMRHLAFTTSKGTNTHTTKPPKGKLRRDGSRRLSTSFSTLDASGITRPTKVNAEIERKVLRILAANPILEAFGNAKTVLNNNSSRFGKFTKLLFTDDEKHGVHIVGSAIETFLLEKSRVIFQTKGERNYHLFYQMMSGLDPQKKKELGLDGGPRSFLYTNQSGCDTVEGIPDKERFEEFISSLGLAGFGEDDIDGILKVTASVLHLGNVKFTLDEKENCHIDESTRPSMTKAASLLGVGSEAMEKCLCFRTLKIGGQKISKPYNLDTSVVNRDSMAKGLFSKMFDWVVHVINKVMFAGDTEKLMWIGILDVFGFECFAYNSFEQLCINLANERLQQFFNVHVIRSEQEEYEREAIYWAPVKVPDNQGCLDLILKKTTGVLALLDSACQTPKATDDTFTSLIFQGHRGNPYIKQVRTLPGTKGRSKVRINGFMVSHYAKDVCYDAKEFLKKNNESVHEDTKNLFQDTETRLVYKVVIGEQAEAKSPSSHGKKKGKARKKALSVGGGFAKQLRMLMKELESTRPFFVRCVKPNLAKKPGLWIPSLVTSQLEAGGLIQALKIIKDGYPTRVGYTTIYAKYSSCLKNPPADMNERDFVEALMIANKFNRSQFVLGLTKVFFKSDQQDFVTELLNPKNALSEVVVKGIQKHLVRKKVVRSMAVVKAYARWQVIIQQRQKREAVYALQALARAFMAKRSVLAAKEASAKLFREGLEALHAMPASRKEVVAAVASQVAAWLSAVSSLEVPGGLRFFESVADGVTLCQALILLGYPTLTHSHASPGSTGARDNVADFISGCKDLGVKKTHIMAVEDLYLLKNPLKVLDTILNLCLVTGMKVEVLPTVQFELDEAKGKNPRSLAFFGEGGVLADMSEERRRELLEPGFIQNQREKRKAEQAAKRAAEKARQAAESAAKKEADRAAEAQRRAAAEAAAAAAAGAERERMEAEEAKRREKAAKEKAEAETRARALALEEEARKAKATAASAIAAEATAPTPPPNGAAPPIPKWQPPANMPTPTLTKVGLVKGEANSVPEISDAKHQDSLELLKHKAQSAVNDLQQAEANLKTIREKVAKPRSNTEVEKSQQEVQVFIRKSKPFVSMLVTLLRKYSQTGMLDEVGLTWRDFPPMTLFETADKQGVEASRWSEWIWDFVNDRIHTERTKKLFPNYVQMAKKADGTLDLSYASITANVMKELARFLVGHYRPIILSQIHSGEDLEKKRENRTVKKGGGFFSSSKKVEEECLISLRLHCNHMDHTTGRAIAEIVSQIPTIEDLWLSGNNLGDHGIEAFCLGLQAEIHEGKDAPLLNRLYLHSCGITETGYACLEKFISTLKRPLVIFIGGNQIGDKTPVLTSPAARAFEKHASAIYGLEGKIRDETLNVIIKYYERILKNPKTAKWRTVSLARACRYTEKQDRGQAQAAWASNMVSCGFAKINSRKGDEYSLADRSKTSWEGLIWSLGFAKTMKDMFEHVEPEALVFHLFNDLLIRVGTPYTGTIEKEHIFEELRHNRVVRRELKLNQVDFKKFEVRFSSIDNKLKGGLMRVQAFIEYAAAFRHVLVAFQEIFGKYQDDKGEVEKQTLFKAIQRDEVVRKYFGIKKFHYKEFNELFQSLSHGRKSMSFDQMVNYHVENKQNKDSFHSRISQGAAPPMPSPAPRVVIRVTMPEVKGGVGPSEASSLTIAAFGDWTVNKIFETIEAKMSTRSIALPDAYELQVGGKVFSRSERMLWAVAFERLHSFPKILAITLHSHQFKHGAYHVLKRTNMRKGLEVKSDKIVTIEKGDLVNVVEIQTDPETHAVRGRIQPTADWSVGERVLYEEATELKAKISARVVAVDTLTLQIVTSSKLPTKWSGAMIRNANPSQVHKSAGWISLKSVKGEICVVKIDSE